MAYEKFKVFNGIIPKTEARLLPENAAQTAENVDLSHGNLKEIYEPTEITTLTDASQESIYKWRWYTRILVCGTIGITNPATWAAITDGEFTITVNVTDYDVTSIDFTGDTTMDNVAATIQARVRTVTGDTSFTCTYNSTYTRMEMESDYALSVLSAVSGGGGTDISSSTYLNGRLESDGSGGSLKSGTQNSEWLSWDTDVDVIASTINDDQYNRIYYTGIADGIMKDKGTYGERNAKLPIPQAPGSVSTISTTSIFDPTSLVTCKWYGGSTPGSVSCSFLGYSTSKDGMRIQYRFPGKDMAGGGPFSICLQSKYQLTVNGTALPAGSFACNMVVVNGEQVPIYDSNDNLYANFEIESYNVSDYDSSSALYFKPHTVEFVINMNYVGSTEYLYYVQSYVMDTGIEGPPSDLSPMVTKYPGQEVVISDLGGAGTNTKYKRLYRSASTTKQADFFYVDQIDDATTSYTDIKDASELSEALANYGNPPDGMSGLTVAQGGFAVAFKGKDVYFSEPYLLNTWPAEYAVTTAYEIVGLAVSGNDIIVMTKGNPEMISGYHPSLMRQTKLMLNQACVSKKGICQVGHSVMYPSPDGIVQIAGGQANLITDKFYTKDEWDIDPDTMIAEVYDKKLYAFTDSASIIFDFDEGLSALTTTDETTTGLWNDLEDDILYMIQSDKVVSWNTSSTEKRIIWKSKDFQYARPVNWSCARVLASDYPTQTTPTDLRVKFRVYLAGSQEIEINVTSDKAFRLPIKRPEEVMAIEVYAYNEIYEVAIATSMADLRR